MDAHNYGLTAVIGLFGLALASRSLYTAGFVAKATISAKQDVAATAAVAVEVARCKPCVFIFVCYFFGLTLSAIT